VHSDEQENADGDLVLSIKPSSRRVARCLMTAW